MVFFGRLRHATGTRTFNPFGEVLSSHALVRTQYEAAAFTSYGLH